jgi:hypothetical protein
MSEKDRFDKESWRTLAEAPYFAVMAMLSVGNPSPIGLFKEVRAAGKATKHPKNANALVKELSAAAGSGKVQRKVQSRVGSPPKDEMLTTAMPGLRAAANTIATLPPDEADAVVTFVMDVSVAVAKAASDIGDSEKVSAAEEDMLQTIENALRSG